MNITVRLWTPEKPASDGSIISLPVWEEYLRSEGYQRAIQNGTILGSLTHRSRNFASLPEGYGNLKGTVGRHDSLMIVDDKMPSPVMKITDVYIDRNIVYADAEILDESLFDEAMAKQITRFKGLLKSGIRPGVSAVIVAYWESPGGGGGDYARSIRSLAGIDITLNPSCPDSGVIAVDGIEEKESEFSEKEISAMESGKVLCKMFSDIDSIPGTSDLPRSSKIGMRVCTLKAKKFSGISESPITVIQGKESVKTFSIGSVKERLRINKMAPRVAFRRLIIDYRGAIKASGGVERMKPEEVAVLKSMFVNDVLLIIKQIHEDILKGKQISTLLGANTVSKSVREACQKLQLPYRMAMMQQQKSGYITRDRMKKIQDAYVAFTDSLVTEVFGESKLNLKDVPGDEEEGIEDGNEKD